MRLSIRHITRYAYEETASSAALRLKLYPAVSEGQTLDAWSVRIGDAEVETLHVDGAGDGTAIWQSPGPVEEITVAVEGVVNTSDTAGVLRGLQDATRPAVYLRDTPLTKPDARIREMVAEIGEGEPLERLHALSTLVHDSIEYTKGITAQTTTAAQAAALGKGVCQDQAQVFIAAARLLDLPARYVTGYLFDPDTDAEAEVSTDETHAWAEAYVRGLGWVGFDITNEVCPTEHYVRLCSGFDAADAAPIRGVVMGGPEETLSVDIAISAGQSQSQSQQ